MADFTIPIPATTINSARAAEWAKTVAGGMGADHVESGGVITTGAFPNVNVSALVAHKNGYRMRTDATEVLALTSGSVRTIWAHPDLANPNAITFTENTGASPNANAIKLGTVDTTGGVFGTITDMRPLPAKWSFGSGSDPKVIELAHPGSSTGHIFRFILGAGDAASEFQWHGAGGTIRAQLTGAGNFILANASAFQAKQAAGTIRDVAYITATDEMFLGDPNLNTILRGAAVRIKSGGVDYTAWHAGNDGAGSGLDADLLDGLDVAAGAVANTIVRRDNGADITARSFQSTIATGTAPITVASTTVVTNLNADLLDGFNSAVSGTASTVAVRDSSGFLIAAQFELPSTGRITRAGASAATWTLPNAGGTVWTDSNDGAGSGLDADLLDGYGPTSIGTASTIALRDSGGDSQFRRVDLTQVTGTAPITVASTTVVTNLNADMVDGQHASAFSLVGHTHAWADVSKTGSSLADLATRSAGDLASGTLADARLSANVMLKTATVPCVLVYHSVNQSISDTVLTTLAWDSEEFDTDTIHDAATNARLTCKTAGTYDVKWQIEWATNATGYRQVEIVKTFAGGGTRQVANHFKASGATGPSMVGSALVALAVDDYITVKVTQNSGGSLNVGGGANDPGSNSYFTMHRIGA